MVLSAPGLCTDNNNQPLDLNSLHLLYLCVVVQVPQVKASGEVNASKQGRVCWRPHGIVDVVTAVLEGVQWAGALQSARVI